MCLIKDPLFLKNRSHLSQSWTFLGLIPWTWALCLVSKKKLHSSKRQISHLTLSWTNCLCARNLLPSANFRGHKSHWWSLFSSCINKTWCLNLPAFANSFLQNLQVFGLKYLLVWTLCLWANKAFFSRKIPVHSSQFSKSSFSYSGGMPLI